MPRFKHLVCTTTLYRIADINRYTMNIVFLNDNLKFFFKAASFDIAKMFKNILNLLDEMYQSYAEHVKFDWWL